MTKERHDLPRSLNPNIRIKAAAPGDDRWRIGIFGEIGWEVRVEEIIGLLKSFPKDKFHFDIWSPGGYAFDALAFYDFVRTNGIDATATGYGFVGSAATVMMLACGVERTAIGANTLFFVHHAWGSQDGTLDKVNDRLRAIYAEATGLSAEDVEVLLNEGDEGNSLTAEEAVAMGFVGSIAEEMERDTLAAAAGPGVTIPSVPDHDGTFVKITEAYKARTMNKESKKSDKDTGEAPKGIFAQIADGLKNLSAVVTKIEARFSAEGDDKEARKTEEGLTETEVAEAMEEARSIAEEAKASVEAAQAILEEAKTKAEGAAEELKAKDKAIAELSEKVKAFDDIAAKVEELTKAAEEASAKAEEAAKAKDATIAELQAKVDALKKLPKAESILDAMDKDDEGDGHPGETREQKVNRLFRERQKARAEGKVAVRPRGV